MAEKIAKLVTFEVTTRVIVDKNEDVEREEDAAIAKAVEKLCKENAENIFCGDNYVSMENDVECPFGTFEEDK